MHYEAKKLENCFADAENYEYRIAISGERFSRLLAEQPEAELRVNERLRRPTFIAALPDGTRIKGELAKELIRVIYTPEKVATQKAAFEAWLSGLE
ncbi:MAG: hypothetical protein LBP28_03875 [Coriobacteriales bacterium]|jgi:hypothetical protein|nr:hypothetical protein [Coriobacteriales bacterium]